MYPPALLAAAGTGVGANAGTAVGAAACNAGSLLALPVGLEILVLLLPKHAPKTASMVGLG